MSQSKIVPLILAAGESSQLGFPTPLARFGRKTALQLALENCAHLATSIVVLGHQAGKIRPAVPAGVRVVVNRSWQRGQLSSLLAGLRCVPRNAAFMLYPVDCPLLTRTVIRRLVAGFKNKQKRQTIVAPVFRRRQGHPVIFAPQMRSELANASTAREVVCREKRRVNFVPVRTPAIWQDFSTPGSYRRRVRAYRRRVSKQR